MLNRFTKIKFITFPNIKITVNVKTRPSVIKNKHNLTCILWRKTFRKNKFRWYFEITIC